MSDTKTAIQTNGNKRNASAYLELEKLEKLMRWPTGASDELFQTLISISPFGVYIARNDQFIMASQMLTRITGYHTNELLKRGPLDIVFPEDRRPFQRDTRKMLNGNQSSPCKFRIRTKNRGIKWVLGTVSTTMYRGKPSIIGSLIDITRHKATEQSLQESNFLFKKLCATLHDGLIIVNNEGKITFWNAAAEKMFGYTIKEALRKKLHKLIIPNQFLPDFHKGFSIFQETGQGQCIGKVLQVEARRKNGTTFPVELSVSPLNLGKKWYAIGIIRDLSMHFHMKRAVMESEDKFRAIVENSPDPIVISTLEEGRILFVSPAFYTQTGYIPGEVIGKTVFDLNLYAHPAGRESFVATLKREGKLTGFESPIVLKNGDIHDLLFSASMFQFRGRQCILATAKDITELKGIQREKRQLYEQLLQAQKMEAVGTLTGGIAHDFNNMLQAILGYGELLLFKKTPGDPDVPKLQQIVKTIQRASELSQELLTFSRKVETRKKSIDVNQVITHIQKLLKRTLPKTINLALQLENNLPPIYANPTQIEQVLLNLALNARDAMPKSGTIQFKTENALLDEKTLATPLEARSSENFILLTISDNGTGMDEETISRIFEPFFTTKKAGKGTGLGLSMVYGIIKEHGGVIRCQSRPGEGTTFRIYLPALQTQAKGKEAEGENGVNARPEGHGETILLIDDEAVLQNVGMELLTSYGYKVILASNSREGIELYRENAKDISLIILDFMMPDMMGNECLREIIKINRSAKVIIVSGYPISNGQTMEALESNACAFIRKPYEGTQLLQAVKRVLEN